MCVPTLEVKMIIGLCRLPTMLTVDRRGEVGNLSSFILSKLLVFLENWYGEGRDRVREREKPMGE